MLKIAADDPGTRLAKTLSRTSKEASEGRSGLKSAALAKKSARHFDKSAECGYLAYLRALRWKRRRKGG